MNRFLIITCLLSLIVLLPSCSWLGGLFGKRSAGQGVLLLQITPWFGARVPVYAQAYTWEKGRRGDKLTTHRVPEDGSVGFVLPMNQSYGVQAYADLNRNGRRDKNEPAASIENLQPLSPHGSGPQYAPIALRLPGKGVSRPTTETRPAIRVLTPEDERRLNLLRQHLPDSIRLPGSLN